MGEQLVIGFPSRWGGARPGAGRPRGKRSSARMAHTRRPAVSKHRPHHVTVKVARGTWNLRSQRCFRPIRDALAAVRRRVGFRVVQFSVQQDHLHLLIESDTRRTLTNAMRALLIRIARGVSRVMGTRGKRIPERYHEHVLGTPTEVRNSLRYVLQNRAIHSARRGQAADCGPEDEFASLVHEELIEAPLSWLLREGWKRAGPCATRPTTWS